MALLTATPGLNREELLPQPTAPAALTHPLLWQPTQETDAQATRLEQAEALPGASLDSFATNGFMSWCPGSGRGSASWPPPPTGTAPARRRVLSWG